MKLLIITQKVDKDDPILGFFHRWIIEFAKHCELLTVICLQEGSHELPNNVRVYSLGKEKGVGKIGRVVALYGYIWKLRKDYTHVFVHMNPIYVVLGWKLWFLFRKPVFLWYTHKHVDWKLRVASWFVRAIFTASEESMRLTTKKKIVTGHGIDTEFFKPGVDVTRNQNSVLTIGRISSTKKVDQMIRAIAEIPDASLNIVGDAITAADRVYMQKCIDLAEQLGCTKRIVWHGSVLHTQTRDFYQRATMFLHLSETGSLDKVLLEALACGLPILSSNDAAQALPVMHTTAETLVEDVRALLSQVSDVHDTGFRFIEENHGLERCVQKLITTINSHTS